MQNQIQPTDTLYQVNISELTARTPQDTDLAIIQQAGDNDVKKTTLGDILNLLASTLAAVATSGDYADLLNKPNIVPVTGTITDDTSGTGDVTWEIGADSSVKVLALSDLDTVGTWDAFIVDVTNAGNHTSHSLLMVNDTAADVTVAVSMTGSADYVITGDTNATFTVESGKHTEFNVLVYDSYPALIIKEY